MEIYRCDKCGSFVEMTVDWEHTRLGCQSPCRGEQHLVPTLDLLTRLVEVKGKDGRNWSFGNMTFDCEGVWHLMTEDVSLKRRHLSPKLFIGRNLTVVLIEAYEWCSKN